MAKCKFMVGDMVKPTKDNSYNITGQGMEAGIVTYVGKCGFFDGDMKIKILKHKVKDHEGIETAVKSRFFEKFDETIVIYRNGNKVIALDKSTGKKAEARCNPADDFDFHIGARIAFERLMGETEEKKSDFKPYLSLECRYGEIGKYGHIGEETGICDIAGKRLRVGDTVSLYSGIFDSGKLSFRKEEPIVKDGNSEFVMGLRGVSFKRGVSCDAHWIIIPNRRYTEIKDGETVGSIKYVKSERTGK